MLVTDGEERAVLAACRGLADAGYSVGAASAFRPAASELSRLVVRRYRTSDPRRDGAAYVEQLREIVARDRPDLLLPGAEASLLRVSAARELFEPHVRMGLPPHDVIVRALDRGEVGAAAGHAGFTPPRTEECSDVEAAARVAAELGYPVVLKPRRSALPAEGDTMRQRPSRLVADEAELRRLAPDFGTPLAVQERVQGPVVSFGGVAARARILGLCAARYRRTWPPTGGSASFTETFAPDAELVAQLERLVADLRWEGLFELETIERQDGSHAAIDFNPRAYGSMSLAVAAGANLPALWARHVLCESPEPVTARAGFHYRWEEAELRNAVWSVRHGRIREAASIFRPTRNTAHAMFRLSDPGPILARPLSLVLRPLRRARRAAASA